jgi:fructokinase
MPAEVLAVGEVLWDLLPSGPALGGAPCNFAFHCAQQGHPAAVISRLGADELGRKARELLLEAGVDCSLLQVDPTHPTGTVEVTLRDGQPSYAIHEGAAWDFLESPPQAEAALAQAVILCFGTLMQRSERSRAAVQRLVELASRQMIVLCDVNLRQSYYSAEVLDFSLSASRWVKLNDEELRVIQRMFGLRGKEESEVTASLRRRFRVEMVALTRGAQGCLVQTDDVEATVLAEPVTVVDTVGAGDAFTAGLVCGLLEGMEACDAARRANRLAGRVAASHGAMPRWA